MDKRAFITGGTGGLGLLTATYLAAKGWHVFVADSNKKALDNLNIDGITPIYVDVSNAESVSAAYEQVKEYTNSLQALINFAGILRVGSMAEMKEEELLLLMNINVMGTFRVNKTFLHLLNQKDSSGRKGRIVTISSETGWQSGGPFNGAYAMSKHAIEGYSDSLRRELTFLDIPVIKIQPGPFKTDMVRSIENRFVKAENESVLFKGQLKKIKTLVKKENKKAKDPQILAKLIYKALSVKNPKAAYSLKADPARTLLEFLPTSWADGLLKMILKK